MRLTVLICTHNRSALLRRVLASINNAVRPEHWAVELLVVANACTDDTVSLLRRYESESQSSGALPLRWTEEPKPGKSNALNRAIPMIPDGVVSFIDDDHRVDREYFVRRRGSGRALSGHEHFLRAHPSGLGWQRAAMGARYRPLPHFPAARSALRRRRSITGDY